MSTMFDKIVYGILDIIVATAETLRTSYKEKSLPKECKDKWIKGYNEFKNNNIYYDTYKNTIIQQYNNTIIQGE